MSKSKQQSRPYNKPKRWMQITVVIVLLAFVAFFVFSNILTTKESVNPDLDKAMKGKAAFSFTKEGDLSFTSPEGNVVTQIEIEIADDDAQRQTGLMFRDKMEMNQGMLFIFDTEMPQSFWMHNTILPLDILYVNSKMEIVKIYKNTKPFSDTSLPSGKPALYVVEVNGGYCDQNGIKEGHKIVFRRN